MKYKLVITHGGKFHADEILAIALAIFEKVISWETPIMRRKRSEITDAEFNNPEILILDIGRRYELSLGNIDHHQDESLPATNLLLLDFLLSSKPELHKQLSQKLFQQISDVDRGIKNKKGLYADFSTIIRNFNGMPDGFNEAIKLAYRILEGYVSNAKYCLRTKKYWRQYKRVSQGKIAIMNSHDKYAGEWQEFAEEDGVYLLLLPNKENKKYYNLMVRDTEIFKISVSVDQVDLNNSGHFAVYESFESALKHAKKMVSILSIVK